MEIGMHHPHGFDLITWMRDQRDLRMSEEEQEASWKLWSESDDDQVLQRLIVSCLPIVIDLVRKHRWLVNQVTSEEDLLSEGYLGLVYAVTKKFDPGRGRLIQYAYHWIRAGILQFIREQGRQANIGSDKVSSKLYYNYDKACAHLCSQGLTPTDEMVGRWLGVPVDRVSRYVQFTQAPLEFDKEVSAGDKGTVALGDLFADETSSVAEQFDAKERARQIAELIEAFKRTLSERDLAIFELRMLAEENPATLQEIGDKFGVSRERIRQNEAKIKTRFITYCEQSGLLSLIAER